LSLRPLQLSLYARTQPDARIDAAFEKFWTAPSPTAVSAAAEALARLGVTFNAAAD
jgi:hypothetical protein